MITLQETWLDDDDSSDDLDIPKYHLYKNSKGRGKGIATYLQREIFTHTEDIKEEKMQLSKFTSSTLEIISIYRSSDGNLTMFNQNLSSLISKNKPTLLLGDFNFCHLDSSSNCTKRFLEEKNFHQLIKEPTHIDGNLLDQAHLKDPTGEIICTVELQAKYFTDHKGLAIMIKKSGSN